MRLSNKDEKDEKATGTNLKAKKDWHLFCPPHIDLKIKKGDDLKEVPKKFLDSLRAEGVI